jgi:hypothetical protein
MTAERGCGESRGALAAAVKRVPAASRTQLLRGVGFEEARGRAEIVDKLIEARVAISPRPAQDARGVHRC